MRLKDLETFQHVAAAGNLHRAARQAGITQSAVSKIVQRLEQRFEHTLLARAGRGVELTEAGRILHETAQSVCLALSELDARMLALRSAQHNILRVGTVPALLEAVLLPALTSLIQSNSDARFEATVQLSNALIPAVQEGHIDLALCFTPDQPPDDVAAINLGSHAHKIVVRESHPLVGNPTDERALAESDWLLPASGVTVRKVLEDFFSSKGYPPLRVVVVTDASSAWFTGILRSTNLVTLMTDQMLRSEHAKGLTSLPFPHIHLSNSLCLIHRRNAYLPPALMKLRTAMATQLAALDFAKK